MIQETKMLPPPSLPAREGMRLLAARAAELLQAVLAGDARASERLERQLGPLPGRPRMAAARETIAKELGFPTWSALGAHVQTAAARFAGDLETFLREGWSWGDDRVATQLLARTPELGTANLHAACVAGDPECVRALLAKDPRAARRRGGPRRWPPILYACWSCFLPQREAAFLEVLQLLLAVGADPNASWRNKEHRVDESALYGCVDANSHRAARVLLEAGADPNDGESLYHACEHDNLEMLQTLGDFALKEQDVSYCIKHAMDFRWEEGIAWFLESGADPNAVHPTAQETSLHWAIKRNCSLRSIEQLLNAGADPNARTAGGKSAFLGIKGFTPLDFALRLGRNDVVTMLEERGASATEQTDVDRFVIACARGDAVTARSLRAQHDGLFGQVDADDQRLVAHVAQMQAWPGVTLMVQSGWNAAQAGGWMGATPLTWALCYGAAETVEFLLAAGASAMEPCEGFFGSPLNTLLRCRWGNGDYVACLEILISAGVTIDAAVKPTGVEALDEILDCHRQ